MLSKIIYAPDPARGWRPWGALVPVLGVLFVAATEVSLQMALHPLHLMDRQENPIGIAGFAAFLIGPFGALAIVVLARVRFVERRSFASIGLTSTHQVRTFLKGHLTGVALIFAIATGIWIAGGFTAHGYGQAFGSLGALGGIAALLVCFMLQSSAEEILFRGWMLSAISAKFGVAAGVTAISAALPVVCQMASRPPAPGRNGWGETLQLFNFAQWLQGAKGQTAPVEIDLKQRSLILEQLYSPSESFFARAFAHGCDTRSLSNQAQGPDMKKLLTMTLLAAGISGAMLGATPASAASFSISIGMPGASFSFKSGGYCDSYGCPDQFWDYPISYCPVYYSGRWYGGPFYYRQSHGRIYFYIRGDWRRDNWNRARPDWACHDRYGPPLDLDFYVWNGFSVRDQWRYSWQNNRNDWETHRQSWDRSNRNDTSWHDWVPTQQRNYDWNRQRDWNQQRDWTKPDWNRSDWERQNHIVHGGNNSTPGGNNPFTGGANQHGTMTGPPTLPPPVINPSATQGAPGGTGGTDKNHRQSNFGDQGTSGSQTGGQGTQGGGGSQQGSGSSSQTTTTGTGQSGGDKHGSGQGTQGTGGTPHGQGSSSSQSTTTGTGQSGSDTHGRGHGKQDTGGSQQGSGSASSPTTGTGQPAGDNTPPDDGKDKGKGHGHGDKPDSSSNTPQ